MKLRLWTGQPWQAFKNFAILFSFTMNVILLIVLAIGLAMILPAAKQIAEPMVGGLNQSFEEMGQAHIVQTIEVEDAIPISFELPVSTETMATIVQPVPMNLPTNFVLPGGGGNINGNVFFELPAGTQLPVKLDIVVPVSQTVPIKLAVDVDIPLQETELGQPFGELQAIFDPLHRFLLNLPGSQDELYDRLTSGETPAASSSDVERAAAP
ncbi:MAG: hypothetical protein ACWGPS_03005 [Candidatus Promineifilaceae bacterium]